MAYPFEQAPTFRDFAERAKKYGCTLEVSGQSIAGPRGTVPIQYLRRTMQDNTILISEPLPTEIDDRMSPDSARRLIAQLKLPDDMWSWAGSPCQMDE